MNKKITLISIGALCLVFVSSFVFKITKGDGGKSIDDRILNILERVLDKKQEQDEPTLGAIPGNYIPTRELQINGLMMYSEGRNINNASSSACTFRLGAGSSTLIDAFAIYDQPISSTVNGQVFMVTRRSDYATTSNIGSTTANATWKVHATSSVDTTSNRDLPPNGWLEIYHTSSSSYTGGGYCGYQSMGRP